MCFVLVIQYFLVGKHENIALFEPFIFSIRSLLIRQSELWCLVAPVSTGRFLLFLKQFSQAIFFLIGHQQLCRQMERALAPVDTLLIV